MSPAAKSPRKAPVARKPDPASSHPGTAVAEKGRRSAGAVLDAAAALLAAEGATALTTRRVAAEAGMHAGNVQYYFRTKQDLVRALLARYIDESRARVAGRIGKANVAPAARLKAGLEAVLVDQCSKDDCAMFRELWAMAAHDDEVAAVLDGFYDNYRDGIAAVLREVEPGLTAARAARVATLLVATIEGLSVVTRPWDESPAAARRRATDLASLAAALAHAA